MQVDAAQPRQRQHPRWNDAAVRDNDGDVAETARYLEIPLGLVQAAVSYYGAYRDEIDQWIEANEQQAAEACAAWSAGQDAIRP